MLNENDDAALLAAETAAAMRDLARTVTDAPPLRLTAADIGLSPARRRRPHGPRFRWSWGGPLLAAAAVVALAVTLVTVKDLPNESVAPRATPAATPGGGLPEYYVALNPASASPGAPDGLIVGDTVAGKTVAVVAPPAGTTIVSVSAAADDRTFAVVAAPTSGGPALDLGFYLLRIVPGGSPAAKLTQLPMEPLPGVIATALSASGAELAVATANEQVSGGPIIRELAVYSVATGQPLRSWSTADTAAIVSDVMPGFQLGQYVNQYPALSWIRGDRAIAFPVLTGTGGTPTSPYHLEMRSVAGTTTGGDLMADSKVIVNFGGAPDSADPCGTVFPVLSGNGTTIFCASGSGPDGHLSPGTVSWELRWQPRATSLANDAQQGFPAYATFTGAPAESTVYPATVWSSSDGATLLVGWSAVGPSSAATTSNHVQLVRFGELTRSAQSADGWTFTALPAPAIFAAGGGAPSIAW